MASKECFTQLKPILTPFQYVLSFQSVQGEIDLRELNFWLLEKNKLCIPDLFDLKTYQITRLPDDLIPRGSFFEPNPLTCLSIPIEQISCILVPALVFDKSGARIGYGKGYYDRLLALASPTTTIIGLGFKEQLSPVPLPSSPHDQKLPTLLLF